MQIRVKAVMSMTRKGQALFFLLRGADSESGGREVFRRGQKHPPYMGLFRLFLNSYLYIGARLPPDSPPDFLPTRQKSREVDQKPPDSEGMSGGGREAFSTPIYGRCPIIDGVIPTYSGLIIDLPTSRLKKQEMGFHKKNWHFRTENYPNLYQEHSYFIFHSDENS